MKKLIMILAVCVASTGWAQKIPNDNLVPGDMVVTNETTTLAQAAARGGFAGTETISPSEVSMSADLGSVSLLGGYFRVGYNSETSYTLMNVDGITLSKANDTYRWVIGGNNLLYADAFGSANWSLSRQNGNYTVAATSDITAHNATTNAHPDKVASTNGTAYNPTLTGTVSMESATSVTVPTAKAGNEPVSLDQALSLLSSSSTVYLSPTAFTGGTAAVTNRSLSSMFSSTPWTVVYSGSVTAGQYLFSFTAPSNLVTSVLAGNQTANLYMTYAGGGGSTLTCKMEGYIFDPATTSSVDYAETSATFAPAKSGTLPATPFTPIAVIPFATNLTGNLRYQIRIKAITASNVSSVTMWGGSNSTSSVSFPVADSVVLGARGATSAALGAASSYDSSTRTLTVGTVLTNGTQFADGVYYGTNGVFWAKNGTNYWILLP